MEKSREGLVRSIFLEARDDLKRFIKRMVKSNEDADDIVQETFVRLMQVVEPGAIRCTKSFLFATARNLVIDAQRRKVRNPIDDRITLDDVNPIDEASCVENNVSVRQEIELLCRAVEKLPPQRQRAFVLFKFYNQSYKEIADDMGLTVKTVENHIGQGLRDCVRFTEEMKKSAAGKDHGNA